MKNYPLIVLFFLSLSTLSAQSYFTSAGLRFGDGIGLTVQQRIAKRLTVEAILKNTQRRDEVLLTGLVERHVPIITRRLNFYVGAGLHKGWITNTENVATDAFGLSFVGGLELSLGRMNISYDFKPAVNLAGGTKTFYGDTALSLRYVFVKDKVFKDRAKKQRKKKRKKARAKRKEKRGGIFIFGN